jgi:hypothetical protein
MKIENTVRVNVYEILQRAIEAGLERGYRRAHKHTDTPGEDALLTEQHRAIMGELCEVLQFDDPLYEE